MAPQDYIRSLFEAGDRVAMVAIPRGTSGDGVVQRVHPAEVLAAERTQAWLRHLNAQRHDVFVGVNPIRPGAWGRTKGAIGEILRVYLDIDEDGDRALARLLGDAGKHVLPPPTHVVRSSPGRYQVLWSLPRGELRPAEAEALTKALAVRYGADTQVTDVARVLRLPGYRNWKRGGTLCSLVCSTGRVARVREFPAIGEVTEPAPVAAMPTDAPMRSSGGDTSPSGRDWAWVRQQLRAGADPEALTTELAARRDDKPHPLAYARRTVDNAVASMRTGLPGRSR